MFNADIDIDVAPGLVRKDYGVRAIIYDKDGKKIKPHPSGIYIADGMKQDVVTGNATLDFEEAEAIGFHKIDLLYNSAYSYFESKDEIIKLASREPDWSKLEDDEFLECLPQIYNAKPLIIDLKPSSIEDLADVLALMRPAKAHLLGLYKRNKEIARRQLYTKAKMVYFKRSHAIAYATMLVCFLNKLIEIYERRI